MLLQYSVMELLVSYTYCCILKIDLKKADKLNPRLVFISYLVQTLSETLVSLWISINQILQELCHGQSSLKTLAIFFKLFFHHHPCLMLFSVNSFGVSLC